MTQMNLSMKPKQTHRSREQTCGCQREGGVWDEEIQTTVYKIVK